MVAALDSMVLSNGTFSLWQRLKRVSRAEWTPGTALIRGWLREEAVGWHPHANGLWRQEWRQRVAALRSETSLLIKNGIVPHSYRQGLES